MSKISVLIIGAGGIADSHLNSLNKMKEYNLYGIFSRTQRKPNLLAKKYGIQKVLRDFKDIYSQKNNFDLIMILVNVDQILNIFEKVKHLKKFIFFEKPIGINLKESLYITQEVKKLKIRSFVGFNRRYYSVLNKGLKKLKSNNKKIVSLTVEGNERIWQIKKIKKHHKYLKFWPFVNSIHTVDLVRYVAGEIDYNNFFKINSKNSYYATMKSKNNIIVSYISNYDYLDGWSVKIYNNLGEYIYLKPLEECVFITKKSTKNITKDISDKNFKPGFRSMHKDLYKEFKKNHTFNSKSNVNDALKSVNLVNRIFFND